jgi:hypothetical protein
MALLSAQSTERPGLVFACLLSPLYWAMMSVAAVKALLQLIKAPSLWEKTTHGLYETGLAAAVSHRTSLR